MAAPSISLNSLTNECKSARKEARAVTAGGNLNLVGLAATHAENDDPHPHDFDEFGFTKLNPCFIKVSS